MNKADVTFPIFDPDTKKVLGHKARSLVHRDGDWHRGIQAYMLKKTPTSIEVLVQKRSPHVDISGLMFDQSLAAQMISEDNLDITATLKRGLQAELHLNLDDMRYTHLFSHKDLRIVKTYKQHTHTLNREITSLFLIEYTGQRIVPNKTYIDETLWIPVEKMFAWQKSSPDLFTKTSRFYAVDPLLSQEIEEIAGDFIAGKKQHEKPVRTLEITYYSEAESQHDVSVHKDHKGKETYYTFDIQENFKVVSGTQHLSSFRVQ